LVLTTKRLFVDSPASMTGGSLWQTGSEGFDTSQVVVTSLGGKVAVCGRGEDRNATLSGSAGGSGSR